MISGRPLSARANGSKGMRLRWKMVVCLGLLLSRICQFLSKRMLRQRFICQLSVVPKRATRHADIGDVYGVGLEGRDEDSDGEDLEQLGEVASSSSSNLRNPSAVPSTSFYPAAQLVFAYDVDEAVLKAMERGKLHDWTKVEFKAICRKQGLSVSRGEGELMERVKVHFQRLYWL